jgi:hypothetical protein
MGNFLQGKDLEIIESYKYICKSLAVIEKRERETCKG